LISVDRHRRTVGTRPKGAPTPAFSVAGQLVQRRLSGALAEARRLAHAHTLAHVLAWAALISWVLRSPKLQAQTEELSALSAEHGFSLWSARAIGAQGRVLLGLGQAREGLAVVKQGLAALGDTGAVLGAPGLRISLAQAHGILGQPTEGLDCLDGCRPPWV
jgi:hypothetical protein